MKDSIIIKFLMILKVLIFTGFGLMLPVFILFVNQKIDGGTISSVGLAIAIFLITKSLIQIVFSKRACKHEHQNDLKWILIGSILICATPIIYIFSTKIFHIYFAQFVYGIGSAFLYPSWLVLWNSALDNNNKGKEWTFYNASAGICLAILWVIGGNLVQYTGLASTFVVVFLISFFGLLILFYLQISSYKIKPTLKMLNFPELRQTYNYDCGAMATEAVLAYFGYDAREDGIIKKAKTTKEGTPIEGIVKVLTDYGLKCRAGQLRIFQIKRHIQKGLPVIMVLQAWTEKKNVDWEKNWSDGHYAIAIGYDEKNIYFEDPSSFLRTYLSYEELEKRWHDVDINGKKYVRYGILVNGKRGGYGMNNSVHMD